LHYFKQPAAKAGQEILRLSNRHVRLVNLLLFDHLFVYGLWECEISPGRLPVSDSTQSFWMSRLHVLGNQVE